MDDSVPSDSAAARAERARQYRVQYRKQYRALNKAKLDAYNNAWRSANLDRVLSEGRDRERRRKVTNRKKKLQLKEGRARAKQWALDNPERAAANRKRYIEKHPDRYRASQSAYAKRNRQAANDRTAAWRRDNPEKMAVYSKHLRESGAYRENSAARRADPEKRARDLASNRDRRRLMRGLAKAGLPAPIAPRSPALERREHEADSRRFFAGLTRKIARQEQKSVDSPPPTPDELRGLILEMKSIREAQERRSRFDAYLDRHRERLYREAEMDSRVRVARQSSPLELDAEVLRRARAATTGVVLPIVTAPPPIDASASIEDVWVRAHVRSGIPIAGYWRTPRG